MQPMIIQNNQLFPVNIPVLYGMNQGFNVGFVSFFDSLVSFYSRDACYATAECDVL